MEKPRGDTGARDGVRVLRVRDGDDLGRRVVMAKADYRCAYCEGIFPCEIGAAKRAQRRGMQLYCGRECACLARRKYKSDAQKRAEKSTYDAQRREVLADQIRAQKHEHFKRPYDPAKAAIERKKNMPRHIAYCRRPEYRKKKQAYKEQWHDHADAN